jgi:hypothetical protein
MNKPGQPDPLRRKLLKGSAVLATGALAPLAQSLQAMAAQSAAQGPGSRLADSPYGPIAPVNDTVTGLPLFGWPMAHRCRHAMMVWAW